jgi:hypothetical protein
MNLLFGLVPIAVIVAAAALSLYAQGEAIKETGAWPRLDIQLLAAFGTGLLVTTLCRCHFMTVPLAFYSAQLLLLVAASMIANVGENAKLGLLTFWFIFLSLFPSLIGSLIALPLATGFDVLLGRRTGSGTSEDELK